MSPIIISIEGNIGSGKSTCVANLKKHFQQHLIERPIVFLQEPVNEWKTIKDSDGVDILTKFYGDQKQYSFAFQMMAYISRLTLLRHAIKENPDAIIITERCLCTDKNVFAMMLYDSGLMNDIEYSIYNKWFDEFNKDVCLSGIIYLKTDPRVAKQRVEKRQREGETIPLAYLEQCNRYHDEWIQSIDAEDTKTQIIDVNQETNSWETWIQLIQEFIQKI